MMSMLKGSSGKGGHMDEQTGNFRSAMETVSKSQIEMLAMKKNSKRDVECLFQVLSRCDTAGGKIIKT